MINLGVLLLGFVTFFVGVVFLFFKNLRTMGVVISVFSLLAFLAGVKSCNDSFKYPEDDTSELEKQEQEKWKKTVFKTNKIGANKFIEQEIEKIKKELVGDSIVIYKKITDGLKSDTKLFEDNLIFDMNGIIEKKHPFKDFNFDKFDHMKFQKKWINNTKFVVPISKEIIYVSGVLANDSSCIVYDGYLNLENKTIYWSHFDPKELLVKDWQSYNYDEPSKLLKLTQSSKEIRVDLIYWQSQRYSTFYTRKVAFRKDLQKNSILVGGEFVPFYKVNQIKGNGENILRNFYQY
jgi:hypothetical protein